jgi:hypothetical protein
MRTGTQIAARGSRQFDTTRAFDEAFERAVADLDREPNLLVVYANSAHDPEQLMAAARQRAPHTPLHGATSCQGVITQEGFWGSEGRGLGILAIADPEGSYGVGWAEIAGDAGRAGQRALLDALEQAGRSGEAPGLVWLSSPPGQEERVLDGMHEVFGRDVPIIGGSAADDAVSNQWKQFANGSVHEAAVVATVMFPSCWVGFAYRSGFTPTEQSARVTRAEGRTVFTLDGKVAAEVYDAWTGGTLGWTPGTAKNVMERTTLSPVGRVADTIHQVPYFVLSHPHMVTADGALTFFTELPEGEELVLMRGSQDGLLQRAGRVAQAAVVDAGARGREVSGALVIYCAGCMLAIRSDVERVVGDLRGALGNRPFLGTFTFGEQGCFRRGGNRHGNLMVSAVVFGTGCS